MVSISFIENLVKFYQHLKESSLSILTSLRGLYSIIKLTASLERSEIFLHYPFDNARLLC